MSSELVGPLPAIHFQDGAAIVYTPPRDTLDPRYDACRAHRVACDCREAEFAEERHESRAISREIETAVVMTLAGHPTWLYDRDGRQIPACQCTGCQIARSAMLGYLKLARQVETVETAGRL